MYCTDMYRKSVASIFRNLLSWWRTKYSALALEFLVLFAFWIVLSGHYELHYIIAGAICALIVTLLTNDFLYFSRKSDRGRGLNIAFAFVFSLRLFAYIMWLFVEIVKANLQVAYLIIHPRIPIDPVLLKFRTQLKKEVSRVTLANSITITPGTVTVDLRKDTYVVHALTPESAENLVTGLMQNKVSTAFGENKEPPPDVKWAHSLEELK
ncbi:MAG: hypothetical protein FJ004_07580 [Chloroflexi bacterium]|nr:hypothetical protein [Chloroflexota bacterium]